MGHFLPSKVHYMSSSFWLTGVESRDFSQAEKEKTACKAEQSHEMKHVFTKNNKLGPFCRHDQFCQQFFLSQHGLVGVIE